MDEDEGDPFVGLGWGAKIVSLANPIVLLILHQKVN